MALMFLGQVPNPETGQRVQNFEAARMFIDQLEMIEVKTKGNLDKQESQLLTQSLTTLRLAFVEAIESGPDKPAEPATAPSAQPAGTAASGAAPAGSPAAPESAAAEEEHRKKFSKKY